MIEVDVKSSFQSVSEAGKLLSKAIRDYTFKQKVIKIIHGYGSSGIGGEIKISVHKSLRKKMKNNEIKAFIPGESFVKLNGFGSYIELYKDLIKNDKDYNKNNDGITFVILNSN